jgi:hypothetical protein
MVNDRYIWCRNCGAIHHVTPFDRAPMYARNGGEIVEMPANDWREFMARHSGHRLDSMVATGSDYYPTGSAVDPMSVRYFEVSNGSETLLVRRKRANIEEPFRYDLIDGRLIESGATLCVQEEAIRKEMKLHFSWAPAAPLCDEKIERFIGLFREVVNEVDPDRAKAVEYFRADDNGAYCELDAEAVDALMTKCRTYFQPAETESLRRFVQAHRESDDVMAVVKRRAVAVERRSEHAAPEAYAFYRR